MKKGSALLIVLGMLSFMLFSGIAFSVYMRQTRLPSSFLRRTSVTRQLAKAALAEAIERIDSAIGDDPHPGVRRGSSGRNYWDHRVFTGQSGSYNGHTISTLTLEGLAYLPPSLINEVRYYSRHTPTAAWQKFRFEAGRFAYTAIDVSDYFDVNRILADRPRSSAASRRVTLAHIFEKNGKGGLHGSQSSGEAEEWDGWLEDDARVRKVDDSTDRITFDGRMPLVSLADFNLLMAKESFGLIKSPFVDYLDGTGSAFYPDAGDALDDEQAEAYRSMTFVTDSHFRKPTVEEKDLSSPENQPFESTLLKRGSNKNFDSVFDGAYNSRSTLWDDYYITFLSRLGMCALCDYLDEDSVPVSLAIPTVERAPMVCAVRPQLSGAKLSIVKTRDPEDVSKYYGEGGKGTPLNTGKERKVSCWFTYQISGVELARAMSLVDVETLYPFAHDDDVAKPTFGIDGQFTMFFTKQGQDVPLSTDNPQDALNPWNIADSSADFKQGVLRIPFGNGENVQINNPTTKKQLRVTDFSGVRNLLPVGGRISDSSIYLYRCCRQWTQTKNEDTGAWEPTTMPSDAQVLKDTESSTYPYITAEGNPDDMMKIIKEGGSLKLNLAVWVRITNSKESNKPVDLVPASVNDDVKERLAPSVGRLVQQYRRYFCEGTQLLKFTVQCNDSPTVDFSLSSLDKQPSYDLKLDSTLVCADPRYNHCPYNWFTVNRDDVEQAWKDNNHCADAGRDGDFYMAVSDQGYLQSVYELAFMPRTTNPFLGSKNLGADARFGDLTPVPDYKAGHGGGISHPTEFSTCINAENMWKTYRPYPRGDVNADAFDDLGFVSGLNGLMVNPYSDSTEVLAAAFANTPLDWHIASTNETANPACTKGVDAFNKKYAWNAYGPTEQQLPWNAILDIAETFRDTMRSHSNVDWEKAFREQWRNDGTDPRRLAGVNLDNVQPATGSQFYSVDKKFLYGFWHDCFAANQQLFLIFVRAEPMMMGGGIAGNAPPQLSSRAVALVWRDPSSRMDNGGSSSEDSGAYIPHGLRILFYHPLD